MMKVLAWTLGTAMLEIQSMIEPSKRHVVAERVKDDSETEGSGDPPIPGSHGASPTGR